MISVALVASLASLLVERARFVPGHRPPPIELIHSYPDGLGRKTILIDPGHGGRKSGAVSPFGPIEKETNLSTALRLKKHLEATGRYRVILTRESDRHVGINSRWRLSNRERADAFISLHADADAGRRKSGMRIIWSSRAKHASSREWSPWLSHYLGAALLQQKFAMHRKGSELMDVWDLRGEHGYVMSWPDYGSWTTDNRKLGVLRLNRAPAVLIETHFLTDESSVRDFEQPETIRRLCEGIELGLLNFFARRDNLLPARIARGADGQWVVQVAALPDRAEADRMLTSLVSLGFSTYIEQALVEESTYYRVRVGPYAHTDAMKHASRALTQKRYTQQWTVWIPSTSD